MESSKSEWDLKDEFRDNPQGIMLLLNDWFRYGNQHKKSS